MNFAEKVLFGVLATTVGIYALAEAWWFLVDFVNYVNSHKDAEA